MCVFSGLCQAVQTTIWLSSRTALESEPQAHEPCICNREPASTKATWCGYLIKNKICVLTFQTIREGLALNAFGVQVDAPDSRWTRTQRSPETYGPAAQVFEGPVVIVYGNQSWMQKAARDVAQDLYVQVPPNVFVVSAQIAGGDVSGSGLGP